MIRPRTLARRLAFQYCFMCDQNDDWDGLPLQEFMTEHCDRPESWNFATDLVAFVRLRRADIDNYLCQCADNWSLGRIAAVERNILRVATAELLENTLSPKIVISEAISMSKKFGSKDSPRFVNGILDKVARLLKEVG